MPLTDERGQALIPGLLLFGIISLFCLSFLAMAESSQRQVLVDNAARNAALRKGMNVAEILNEISFNNRSIAASLGMSINAFAEAGEYGLLMAATTPMNKAPMMGSQRNVGGVAADDFDEMESLFSALETRAARGFSIAAKLTAANRDLRSRLDLNGFKGIFVETGDIAALCFSLEAQKDLYRAPGVFSAPVVEGTLSTLLGPLHWEVKFMSGNCTIEPSRQSTVSNVLSNIPVAFLPHEAIFDAKKRLEAARRIWGNGSSRTAFSFLVVDGGSKGVEFLRSLETRKIVRPSDDTLLKEMSGRSHRTLFDLASRFLGNSRSETQVKVGKPSTVPRVVITNPRLKKARSCSGGTSPIVLAEDFDNALSCGVDTEGLLHAFFEPHWTPQIVSQKRDL